MQKARKILDSCVVRFVRQTTTNASGTCDVDHNTAFIKGALRCALNELSMSIMDDFLGIKDTFENSFIYVGTAPRLVTAIAAAIVRNATAVGPMAKPAADTAIKEIDGSENALALRPRSSLRYGPDWSYNKNLYRRNNKLAKKRNDRRN